jgi:hypothetical protein
MKAVAAALAIALSAAAAPGVSIRPRLDRASRLDEWTLDGSGVWQIAGGMLTLAKAGTPAGPIRRPAALAILKSDDFVRATVAVRMRSTTPIDVVRRDLEIVFGYQSPSRFYYVHLAGLTDAVHNGIFLVNDADRRRIDEGKAPPQLADLGWHAVRLERDGATGRIAVYVDGAASPAMTASDTTLRAGRVGVGSFDDTGEFQDIRVDGSR